MLPLTALLVVMILVMQQVKGCCQCVILRHVPAARTSL
jgi:hypothetical protein